MTETDLTTEPNAGDDEPELATAELADVAATDDPTADEAVATHDVATHDAATDDAATDDAATDDTPTESGEATTDDNATLDGEMVDGETADGEVVEGAVVEGAAVEGAAEADDDDSDGITITETPISPYDRPGRWYVLHTQSGYENKVRKNIEARISSMNMEERIFEVVIPLEDVVEFKNGKKVVVQKKVFPGYLLCRMKLNDDSWFVVRNTPGVTGFVGAGNKPSPLPRREVESFLQVPAEGEEAARKGKPRLEFEDGETVRVKEGPFADFQGQIVEINEDQLKVKVLVNIFGRETPVELEFAQVGKL